MLKVNLITYLKSKWLFLLIVAGLILANAWIWAKVIPETKIEIKVDTNIVLSFFLAIFAGVTAYYAMRFEIKPFPRLKSYLTKIHIIKIVQLRDFTNEKSGDIEGENNGYRNDS